MILFPGKDLLGSTFKFLNQKKKQKWICCAKNIKFY